MDYQLIALLADLKSVFAAVLVEVLLYGIHFVLFWICVSILFMRRNPAQLVVFFSVAIMFALATADIFFSFRLVIHDIPTVFKGSIDVDVLVAHVYPKNPLFVTNNLIADALLLHRCYVIWQGQKYVILASSILLVSDTVWGYVGTRTMIFSLEKIFNPVYLWTVFSMNVTMTIVTAGRIWWIARGAGTILRKQDRKRYLTVVAVIIESGAIYSIAILLLLVVPHQPYRLILAAIVMRVVGIMPTMMLVQVELRKQAQIIREDSVIPLRTPPGARTIASISPTAHHNTIDPLPTLRTDSKASLESGLLAGHGTEMHPV